MDIQYVSSFDQAQFAEIVHDGGELPDLFAQLMVQMDVDTDYSSVIVSCYDSMTLSVTVEDSPYRIVLDEQARELTLYTRNEYDDEGEDRFIDDFDFDEDGVDMIIDLMISRVLTEDTDEF